MFQGRVIGDVARKDCTTLFHGFPQNYSDVYFFRLECQDFLKFTFTEPVNILAQPGNQEVRSSPSSAGLTYSWTHTGKKNKTTKVDVGKKNVSVMQKATWKKSNPESNVERSAGLRKGHFRWWRYSLVSQVPCDVTCPRRALFSSFPFTGQTSCSIVGANGRSPTVMITKPAHSAAEVVTRRTTRPKQRTLLTKHADSECFCVC